MNIQAPLALDAATEAPATGELQQVALPGRASIMRRLARDKAAALAAIFLTIVVLAAIFAPIVAPYDPYFTDLSKAMQAPSAAHWFGTDTAGRDVLSRVIYGARNTLAIGLIGVIVGGVLGGLLGILAAYFRKLDGWIMRIVDIMLAFPAILLGLAVAAIAGAGLTAVIIAVVVATIPDVARVARGAAIGVMGQEFMEAGRAVGVSDYRADLALPDAELHLDHLRVPDAALRADHPDRLGAELPGPRRAAADRRARHDGRRRAATSSSSPSTSPSFRASRSS